MTTSQLTRIALAAGIAFGLVQITTTIFTAAFVFTVHPPAQPTPEVPLEEIAAGFAEHAGIFAIGNYLYVLQLPFLIAFVAGIAAVLSRTEGDEAFLGKVVLASGAILATIVTMGAVTAGLASRIALLGGDAPTISVIDGLVPLSLALAGFPRAMLLGAVVVAGLQHRLVGRSIVISGALLAGISLASTGTLLVDALFPLTALASLGFAIWSIALAAALLRRRQPAVDRPGPIAVVPA